MGHPTKGELSSTELSIGGVEKKKKDELREKNRLKATSSLLHGRFLIWQKKCIAGISATAARQPCTASNTIELQVYVLINYLIAGGKGFLKTKFLKATVYNSVYLPERHQRCRRPPLDLT